MLASLSLVADFLRDELEDIFVEENHPGSLRGVRFLKFSNDLDAAFLYTCMMDQIKDYKIDPELNYLIFGTPDERFKSVNRIVFSKDADMAYYTAKVVEIFSKLMFWDNTLYNYALNGKTVQSLLDASRGLFESHLLVYDASLRVVAFTNPRVQGDTENKFFVKESDQLYLSPSVYQRSLKNGVFKRMNSQKGAFHYKSRTDNSSTNGVNVIMCHISLGGIILGVLVLSEDKKPFSERHYSLTETLAQRISEAMKNSAMLDHQIEIYTKDIFIDALVGARVSEVSYSYQLSKIGWKMQGKYNVLAIKSTDGNELPKGIRYLFLSVFPDSQIKNMTDHVVIILRNKTLASLKSAEKAGFLLMLKRENLKCGASYDFIHFPELANYYKQAQSALDHCNESCTDYPVALYEDFFVNHMINVFDQDFEVSKFVHPSIRALAQYDINHNSELTKTLYTYLINDRSYTVCADNLSVHKSTINYRINKILDIIGEDCLIPSKKLCILLSLEVAQLQIKSSSVELNSEICR